MWGVHLRFQTKSHFWSLAFHRYKRLHVFLRTHVGENLEMRWVKQTKPSEMDDMRDFAPALQCFSYQKLADFLEKMYVNKYTDDMDGLGLEMVVCL